MRKKELLFSLTKKDFVITYYSGTGAGGQHRNKHQNWVRIKHPESGVIATGCDTKSRVQNKKNAFIRLTSNKKFKIWLKIKATKSSLDMDQIERRVEKSMDPENIKIEYF